MTPSYLLILKKGARIHEALIEEVKRANLKGIAFSGIGALRNPIVGFFDEETKKYIEKRFDGLYELLSLQGNVAKADDKWLAHIHVTLGDEEYHALGGHLISAEVGITVELLVTPLEKTPIRTFDQETGLKLIQ